MEKNTLFICNCSNAEHQFIIRYDSDYYDEICISVHLTQPETFFKRINKAVKYIFGHRSDYGDFQEILLDIEQTHKLVSTLQKHLTEMENKQ
jgi:hypothetical protein